VPIYTPSVGEFSSALVMIAMLFVWAIKFPPRRRDSATPPSPMVLGVGGAIWSTLWFGLVVLAFGKLPQLSAPTVFVSALLLMFAIVFWLTRWAVSRSWTDRHSFGLFFGTLTGAMLATFAGFIGSATMDIVFKAVINGIAFVLMLLLGRRIMRGAAKEVAAPGPLSPGSRNVSAES
jgi:hypothetical protein